MTGARIAGYAMIAAGLFYLLRNTKAASGLASSDPFAALMDADPFGAYVSAIPAAAGAAVEPLASGAPVNSPAPAYEGPMFGTYRWAPGNLEYDLMHPFDRVGAYGQGDGSDGGGGGGDE